MFVKIRLDELIVRLWAALSSRRRRQFFSLMALMAACSVADLFSIGLVFPFLAVLSSPDSISSIKYIGVLAARFQLDKSELLTYTTVIFIVFLSFAAFLRLLLLYSSVRYSNSLGSEFTNRIYWQVLNRPYLAHISTNSSEVINGVINKSNAIPNACIYPLLRLISTVIFFKIMILSLLILNPLLTISIFSGLTLVYIFIAVISRRRLESYGRVMSSESTAQIRLLQEGLGGIRDIIINGDKEFFRDLYKTTDYRLRLANGNHEILSTVPRLVIEPLGMISIVLVAWFFFSDYESSVLIPTLGVIALSAQRLLPMLQQGFSSWALLTGSKFSVFDALNLMGSPTVASDVKPTVPVKFESSVAIRNVTFRYPGSSKEVFSGVSLEVKRGQKVGLVGVTGGGKSTIIDIFMGLILPDSGALYVDGVKVDGLNVKGWYPRLAHVPQHIFLCDSTIAENIAFGKRLCDIDTARLLHAARVAQVDKFAVGLDEQYLSIIGERGVRFSGGQRQRIGIARALYRGADLLILDEATSALDGETERRILNSIVEVERGMTVIMISHRVSSLSVCDIIYELDNGALVKFESYKDFAETRLELS